MGAPGVGQNPRDRFPWIGLVIVNLSALRKEPKIPVNKYDNIIADLPKGAVVKVARIKNGWLEVKTKANGRECAGYVSQELVEYVRPCEDWEPIELKLSIPAVEAALVTLKMAAQKKKLQGQQFKPGEKEEVDIRLAIVALKRDCRYSIDENSYEVSPACKPSDEQEALLKRLGTLADYAKGEGGEALSFARSIQKFEQHLRECIAKLCPNEELPNDLKVVFVALRYWKDDSGQQWGEGRYDSDDLKMSYEKYATVPDSQYKCNAYVAEVLYVGLGVFFLAIKSKEEPGKYFPHQAKEWGDVNSVISNFEVTQSPVMGDIWSNGSHTGIYLGRHDNKELYISARDDSSGIFGTKLQKTHGVQIKFLPEGGVYRHYAP